MKAKLKAFVKNNRLIYTIYYYMGSLCLRILGCFVRRDPDLLLFVSYGGQKYDDSPRVVYEELLRYPVSEKHRYVWAFIDPAQFSQVENKVKVDTLAYYITALKAGYWITNSSASRGLNFRKKKTVNVLFPHGMTGIKKIGTDIVEGNESFSQGYHETFDYIFIEGKKEREILKKAWDMPEVVFHTTGLPRNDNLVPANDAEVTSLKKKLGIPADKKVILYAPTFREYERNSSQQSVLGIPFDLHKWEKALGQEYVMLITAHYEVAQLTDVLPDNQFVINAFKYPEINNLLKVADILISDYSSVIFDYSILERPIFCYGYDYQQYNKERGFYTDLQELYSQGVLETEEDLLRAICNIDYAAECAFTKEHIKDEYIASYGNAAQQAIHIIFGENYDAISA